MDPSIIAAVLAVLAGAVFVSVWYKTHSAKKAREEAMEVLHAMQELIAEFNKQGEEKDKKDKTKKTLH